MKFLEKITPRFFKQLDRSLLLNAPLVWRTRIHYLLASFVLGNAALIGMVYCLPIRKDNVFSMNTIEGFSLLFSLFLVFVLLYWCYTQFKYKLTDAGIKAKILTFGLYLLGCTVVASHFIVFSLSIQYRTANVVDNNTFQEEQKYLLDQGYIDYIKTDRPGLDAKSTAILGTYGVTPRAWEYMRGEMYDSELERAVECIDASKKLLYRSYKSVNRYGFRGFYKMMAAFLFFGILLTPSLLLMVSFSKLQEIFLVGFLHFLGFGAGVFSYEIWRVQIDNFYLFFTLLLMGAVFSLRKNSKITRIVFFMLLTCIPVTAWVVGVGETNFSDFWETSIYVWTIVAVSFVISIFFANLMSKRLSEPK